MNKLVLLFLLCACNSFNLHEKPEVLTSGDTRLCIMVEYSTTEYFYVYHDECLLRDPVRGVCAKYDKNGRLVQELPYNSVINIRPSR